ncbi:hypothetical protein RFI_00649 [Reticulomyxa filosa]|uniref:RGS domain-containing protein n=1 Tax=Reticulomyxa filosa TaxID=46433 RepID=X6PEG8_RETFI|nr:hypothetical protein RFI_00649 [Reticulomyxa filosa]|eukprot:ETO36424.1 hypothetical protein RFI_00649 [Reticulomyxa filosa]
MVIVIPQLIICELGRGSHNVDLNNAPKHIRELDLTFELYDLFMHILHLMIKLGILYEWKKIKFNDYYQVRIDYWYGFLALSSAVFGWAGLIAMENTRVMSYSDFIYLAGLLSPMAITSGLTFLLWYPLYMFGIDRSLCSSTRSRPSLGMNKVFRTPFQKFCWLYLKKNSPFTGQLEQQYTPIITTSFAKSKNGRCVHAPFFIVHHASLQSPGEEVVKCVIQLDPAIPISDIVSNDNLTVQQKAHKLVEKYIAVGAEFEVNISFGLRQQVITLKESASDNQTYFKWAKLCNTVISNLAVLLSDNLSRLEFQSISP